MDKLEKEIYKKLVKENPVVLRFLPNEARLNKEIVLAACRVDHEAIRYALPGLTSNAVFVFNTQGKNPEKLHEIYDRFPKQFQYKEIETLIAISNVPTEFVSLPTEYFRNKEYIQACKDCVAFHVDRKLRHRKEKKCAPTIEDISLADDLFKLVNDKIYLENKNIARENQQDKNSTSKLKQIAKDISRR